MRCLVVLPSLKRAGAEAQTVDLANGLCEQGLDVFLRTFDDGLDLADKIDSRINFQKLYRRRRLDLKLAKQLAGLIDRESIDVVHASLQIAVFVAWMACRLSRTRPPVVAAVHTTYTRDFKSFVQEILLYRWVLGDVSRIVFVCKYQREKWLKRYPALQGSSSVVYNGVDCERYVGAEYIDDGLKLRKELGIKQGAFVFGIIAQFRREKSHNLLVQAFAQLDEHTYLICAGDGEYRQATEDLARELGVLERVRFLGSVADSRPVIAASDATVLASTSETFSMAMLESLSMGVPMAVPTVGGLQEAVIDGVTGLVFPSGNIEQMARKLGSLSSDPGKAKEMGVTAVRLVRNKFSRTMMIDESRSVLERAMVSAK